MSTQEEGLRGLERYQRPPQSVRASSLIPQSCHAAASCCGRMISSVVRSAHALLLGVDVEKTMIGITRRQITAALAAGALARPALGQPAPEQRAGSPRELDEVLNRIMADGGAPGVVAAAATDKGPFYTGAVGKRNVAKGPEMTPDSVFWIASM